MWPNIFQICLALSVISLALSYYSPRVSTKTIANFPDDISTYPFVKLGNESKLYHFGEKQVSWFKAFLICRTLGASLTSFDSLEEWSVLSDYLAKNFHKSRYWWTSGADLDVEGEFSWYHTGEQFTFTKWSKDQPDDFNGVENCVLLWLQNNQYEMNDFECTEKAYYICESKKPTSLVVIAY